MKRLLRSGASLALVALTLGLAGCSGEAGSDAETTEGALGKTNNASFDAAYAKMGQDREANRLGKRLEDFRFVFVPGFFNVLADLGQGGTDQTELYFERQMSWLDEHEICWTTATTSVVMKPEANVDAVLREIDEPAFGISNFFERAQRFLSGKARAIGEKKSGSCRDKPAILVSHSRGSVDVLAALIGDKKPTRKVAGWISYGGMFQGSPLAQDLFDKKVTEQDVAEFGRALQRIPQTEKMGESVEKQAPNVNLLNAMLEQMSTKPRAEYMRTNASKVDALLRSGLPVISVGTVVRDGDVALDLFHAPRTHLARTTGQESDGLVLRGSAHLKTGSSSSVYVEYAGDHISPVIDVTGRLKSRVLRTIAGAVINGFERPDALQAFQALSMMTLDAQAR
jgi:hypothetical protein